MAQATKYLRDLLEKIKGDTQRALAFLPSDGELRSLGWKCIACGHVKHFTRPVTAAVADRRPEMQRRCLSGELTILRCSFCAKHLRLLQRQGF